MQEFLRFFGIIFRPFLFGCFNRVIPKIMIIIPKNLFGKIGFVSFWQGAGFDNDYF